MKESSKNSNILLKFFKKLMPKFRHRNHDDRYIPHSNMTDLCREMRKHVHSKMKELISSSDPIYDPVPSHDSTFFEFAYDNINLLIFYFICGPIYLFPSLFIYLISFIQCMFLSIVFYSVFIILFMFLIATVYPYKPEFPKFKIV